MSHYTCHNYVTVSVWQDYLKCRITIWMSFYQDWLNFKRPIYVLRYEDLKKNTVNEMIKVMTFLGFTPSEERIKCLQQDTQGSYNRQNKTPTDMAYNNYETRSEINNAMVFIDKIISKLK